jgi:hypothetical protein
VIYNGVYSTCINGGYYLDQGMKILAEALERYEVDGLFFNMFGNQSRDYSGLFVGHCHRDSCRTKYRALYGKELPAEPDEQYRQFMFQSSREVAAEIGKLIRSKRPNAGTSTTYRSTRRHHVGVEHGNQSFLAAVAVYIQRQCQWCAEQRAREDVDQPEHAIRRLRVEVRDGAATGDRAACVAEPGSWRRAGVGDQWDARKGCRTGKRSRR